MKLEMVATLFNKFVWVLRQFLKKKKLGHGSPFEIANLT